MIRDYGTEIDELKNELQELKSLLITKKAASMPNDQLQEIVKTDNENLKKVFEQLDESSREKNDTGAISYVGTFESAGRRSIWVRDYISADRLLSLNENKIAEKVLNSIGNGQRLSILLALLKNPMSVTQLVDKLEFNTTGQAYHHLKSLMAADLVSEDEHGEKGTYIVRPHRVQGIIMMLAGIWDMIDSKYTSSTWE
jgi:DNA gyrase subunit B